MSPGHFNDQHAKKESSIASSPSVIPLKINKDSHLIKKSSSSSSCLLINGVAATATNKKSQQQPPPPPQRHPVIIYTHSPKIIHTHPKDFMALVQKLTGLSRSSSSPSAAADPRSIPSQSKLDPNASDHHRDSIKKVNKAATMAMMNDDNESTSVVTDENNGGACGGTTTLGEAQVNSCFLPPPIFDPPNPCLNSIPFCNPNSADFLCTAAAAAAAHHQPFYNYSEDSLFFMPNIRSSLSSSTLEGMKELPDF